MDPGATAGGLERTLPREAYVSEAFHELERERIFRAEWLCAGRVEVLERPGEFLVVEPIGERLIVVRGKDGRLRAFHDVCRHRGSRLVLDEPPPLRDRPRPAGRFRGSIVCPYHAWTYGLDGRLRNAPFLDERHGLRKEDLSLYEVPLDVWGGFVFVHLGGRPTRSLAQQLGPIPLALGRIGASVDFFGPSLALLSMVGIDVWQWTPFMLLLMLAGLESLPPEPFEAARVDGAGPWFTFTRVTLPLLRPVIAVAVLIRALDAFKVFEYVFAITRGGPGTATETLQYQVYRTGFQFFRLGEAAAMAFVLVAIVLAIVVILYRRLVLR